MDNVIAWFKGKKTYFILGAAGIIWILESFGIIPPDTATNAYGILGMLGGATMAAKINRLGS